MPRSEHKVIQFFLRFQAPAESLHTAASLGKQSRNLKSVSIHEPVHSLQKAFSCWKNPLSNRIAPWPAGLECICHFRSRRGLAKGNEQSFTRCGRERLCGMMEASALEFLLMNDPGPFANHDELVGRNLWNGLGGAVCPANAEVGYGFISQPEM